MKIKIRNSAGTPCYQDFVRKGSKRKFTLMKEDFILLKFSLKSLSPLAIVVNTASSGTDSPPTSDNWMVYVYAGIAVVSAGAFIALWATRKKSGENND